MIDTNKMNDHIRDIIKGKMERTGETQLSLEDATGIKQGSISRLLTGASGRVLETWAKILNHLGLALIAVDAEDVEEIKAQQLAKRGSSNG